MLSFRDSLNEAAATVTMKDMKFYHGTATHDSAKNIMHNGLKPRNIQGRSQLAPVAGRVYLTHDIAYAYIYALGGDFAGSDYKMASWKENPFGYVFVVDGKDLGDVQPDEDSVGEWFYNHSAPPEPKHFRRKPICNDPSVVGIYNHIKSCATPKQLEKALEGEYSAWAAIGKKAVKTMPDTYKVNLIMGGAHVANGGEVMPTECWLFDKARQNPAMKKDASNFFQLAKKIWKR